MNQLTIEQGDSVRIAITLPIDRMSQLQDVICKIGRFDFSLGDETIEQVNDSNLFILNLKSNITAEFTGTQKVLIALSYSDIGVRKISKKNSLSLVVEGNKNPLNNDSISNFVNATIDILIENQVVTDNILSIEQGDSVRLAITTPIEKISLLEDLSVQIGHFTFSLSNQTIEQDSNNFYINLNSNITAKLSCSQDILIALDYSDIGVRKLSANQVFKLVVNANPNNYYNYSSTNYIAGTVNVEIVENTEVTSSTIMQQLITAQPYLVEYIKGPPGLDAAGADSFENTSKNLRSWACISSTANSLVLSDGVNQITKTITRPNATTVIITLSGDTPAGINLVKTITLNNGALPTWEYS